MLRSPIVNAVVKFAAKGKTILRDGVNYLDIVLTIVDNDPVDIKIEAPETDYIIPYLQRGQKVQLRLNSDGTYTIIKVYGKIGENLINPDAIENFNQIHISLYKTIYNQVLSELPIQTNSDTIEKVTTNLYERVLDRFGI